jgi:pimeloyl-ACP methyl ester carboxylesterase
MRSLDLDGLTDLSPSRPGMGHSTDVPLRQRLNTWIELVPRFLAHLQIEHVTLASHSAGTIYLLNTLIRCRNILHPNTPMVILVGMILIHP